MKPYICPVCEGRQKVRDGFYNFSQYVYNGTSVTGETCRTCNGVGVVWSPSEGSVSVPINQVTGQVPSRINELPDDIKKLFPRTGGCSVFS